MKQARFRGLTKAQEDTFARIAVDDDTMVHPARAQALIKKGLIESYQESAGRDRLGKIIVTRYRVPISVHIEWCEWCSVHVKDEEEESL